MPTRAASDLVSVRKTTKQALAKLKGEGSYDQLLRALLEQASPKEIQERMARLGEAEERADQLRSEAEERVRRGVERSPEKQALIARLAKQRWEQWQREGRATFLAPRLVAWNPRPPAEPKKEGVKLAWQPRRGFPPGEGPSDAR